MHILWHMLCYIDKIHHDGARRSKSGINWIENTRFRSNTGPSQRD